METANDNVNVKCTRCGAKATVGGKDYFYTCPVCHGQINKEAARKNHEGVSSSNQSTHVAKAEEVKGGKINVKCTYCGAKAMVSDEYYLYTCPVCNRQVNTQSAKSKFEREKVPMAQPKTSTQSVQKPVTTSQTSSNPQKAANASNVKFAGIGKLFIAGGILLWLLLKSIIPVLSFIIGLLLVGFGLLCNDTENEITGK